MHQPDEPDHHDENDMPSDLALRVKALESLLIEKGLVDPAALDAIIEYYEHKVGPHNGARVIARAWVDPEYKKRLMMNGTAALAAELRGADDAGGPDDGTHYYERWLVALEGLVAAKGLTDDATLLRRKEDWVKAHRSTPHGQPVELKKPESRDWA